VLILSLVIQFLSVLENKLPPISGVSFASQKKKSQTSHFSFTGPTPHAFPRQSHLVPPMHRHHGGRRYTARRGVRSPNKHQQDSTKELEGHGLSFGLEKRFSKKSMHPLSKLTVGSLRVDLDLLVYWYYGSPRTRTYVAPLAALKMAIITKKETPHGALEHVHVPYLYTCRYMYLRTRTCR